MWGFCREMVGQDLLQKIMSIMTVHKHLSMFIALSHDEGQLSWIAILSDTGLHASIFRYDMPSVSKRLHDNIGMRKKRVLIHDVAILKSECKTL